MLTRTNARFLLGFGRNGWIMLCCAGLCWAGLCWAGLGELECN
jgi:hypothetical protein